MASGYNQPSMTRADLIRVLRNTVLEEHRNLTREQARAVVNEIFGAIAEDLENGEVACLPVGNLGVHEQERQPMQGRFLDRDCVLYKDRYIIEIHGGEELDLEPTPPTSPPTSSLPPIQPPPRLDSNKISPEGRRKLIAAGIKAGKSLRLIAQELKVTGTTIQRDMKVQGINANKKPTVTRRKKKAAAWNVSRRATPERKVAVPTPTEPLPPTPTKPHQLTSTPTKPLKLPPTPTERIKLRKRINLPPRPVFTPRVVAKPLQPEPPKPRSPEIPLSPEQLRRRRLEEMLQLVGSWLLERKPDYWLAINVLDKAWNHLAASPNFFVRGLPESTMSAAQLRDHTRPPGMDSASRDRREEVCALWLARWLADWAREDKQLRKEVLDQIRALVTA